MKTVSRGTLLALILTLTSCMGTENILAEADYAVGQIELDGPYTDSTAKICIAKFPDNYVPTAEELKAICPE